jgi:hypothetical protein
MERSEVNLELGAWALAFIAFACLLSGFTHGVIGFGYPIMATPLVALVIDVRTAIGLLAPVTLLLVVVSAVRGGSLVAIVRRFWLLPLSMAAGAWLGTLILLAAPPEPFLLLLALIIALYLNLDRLGRGRSRTVERLQAPFGLGFGFVAGIFEAAANVAGPVLLIYFMLIGLAPGLIIQTLNLCFTAGKSAQVLTWASTGALGSQMWLAIGALALPSVGALLFGMRLRERIDALTYRAWLHRALWLMVALLVGQFAVSSKAFASDAQLFAAIDEGKEVLAEGLIARGRADPNARNAERETPLHRAIEKGMKGLTQALVGAKADLRARSQNGETVLHLAALHADPYYVDLLLKAGADPRTGKALDLVAARNDDGETPLYWAALSGNLVPAQRLLNDGADANVADIKGNLPLHAAADGGFPDLVELLLLGTANPGVRNREGKSAWDYARERGYEDIGKRLERFHQ